jgi:predicted ribosomally synthesized peptide with SipW-like signal peptide
MRKVLLSILSISFVAAVIATGTLAYFYDIEVSDNNTITAGTIDISVDGENPWVTSVVVTDDAKPSLNFCVYKTVCNNGTNPTMVYAKLENITEVNNVETEPELEADPSGEINDLSNVTWFDLAINEGEGWIVLVYEGTITVRDVEDVWYQVTSEPLQPGECVDVLFSFHMMSEAGNEYQGDSMSFDLIFKAFQVNDEDAPY